MTESGNRAVAAGVFTTTALLAPIVLFAVRVYGLGYSHLDFSDGETMFFATMFGLFAGGAVSLGYALALMVQKKTRNLPGQLLYVLSVIWGIGSIVVCTKLTLLTTPLVWSYSPSVPWGLTLYFFALIIESAALSAVAVSYTHLTLPTN